MSAPARLRMEAGAAVPAVSLRVLLVVVAGVPSLLVLQDAVQGLGLVLAVVAGCVPRLPVAWALIALIAFGEATRDPAAVGPELLPLVACIHATAVLAVLAPAIPVRGRLELAALARPARTFLAIEAPVQATAALVLLLRGAPSVPLIGVLGGAVLVGLTVLLTASRGAR